MWPLLWTRKGQEKKKEGDCVDAPEKTPGGDRRASHARSGLGGASQGTCVLDAMDYGEALPVGGKIPARRSGLDQGPSGIIQFIVLSAKASQ